jgi:hypothetical protein
MHVCMYIHSSSLLSLRGVRYPRRCTNFAQADNYCLEHSGGWKLLPLVMWAYLMVEAGMTGAASDTTHARVEHLLPPRTRPVVTHHSMAPLSSNGSRLSYRSLCVGQFLAFLSGFDFVIFLRPHCGYGIITAASPHPASSPPPLPMHPIDEKGKQKGTS